MAATLPARYAVSLLRLLDSADERLRMCDQVGLSQDDLKGETIALASYCLLFNDVMDAIQVQLHGDDAELVQRFSSYRLVLESMCQAQNLEEAIKRADTFFRRLGFSVTETYVERLGEQARWVFEFSPLAEADWSAAHFSMDGIGWLPGVVGHSTGLWIWHRLASWLLGQLIPLQQVAICDLPPEHPDRYQSLFNAAVLFDQDQFSLVFDEQYLTRPICQKQESVDVLMKNFLQGLFDLDAGEMSIVERIKALIGDDFTRPMPTLENLADQLHVSVPTLHRHLQKAQSSYQKIKDECRQQQAEILLQDNTLPIKSVAEQLGFSDSGTFHRAFKKWTGLTPTAYRESKVG